MSDDVYPYEEVLVVADNLDDLGRALEIEARTASRFGGSATELVDLRRAVDRASGVLREGVRRYLAATDSVADAGPAAYEVAARDPASGLSPHIADDARAAEAGGPLVVVKLTEERSLHRPGA